MYKYVAVNICKCKKVKKKEKWVMYLRHYLSFVGNVFSSLAGLEFEWSLLPDTSTQGEEMVDILRYCCRSVVVWENIGTFHRAMYNV